MTTGWSLSGSGITGDLSPSTKTMSSDEISGLSPIPIRDDGSPAVAMIVGTIESDIEVDRESVTGSVYGSASCDSNHTVLLEAQRALAEERFHEAEAIANARRAKTEMARIAVEIAAHQASSRGSVRARSRLYATPTAAPPLADAVKMEIQIDGDGVSRDLSSLMHRAAYEEKRAHV